MNNPDLEISIVTNEMEMPEPLTFEGHKKVFQALIGAADVPSKQTLISQKRNLCNIRAEFDKDIAKMQQHRAAIDAGIQALEAQINQMIDKPPE